MELRDYSPEDRWLTEALESDPAVMQDRGGPTPKDKLEQAHRRRLAAVSAGDWCFAILAEAGGPPVGTIGIWQSQWRGAKIHEMGWMILPAFQGRGLATAAGRLVLQRARSQGRFQVVHAFPAVANAASNAICLKLGFSLVEEVAISYNGPPCRSHDWRIDLSPGARIHGA